MDTSSNCFYGETLKCLSASGVIVSETSYAANLQLNGHSHDSPYFCFVLQGGFQEKVGLKSRAARPSMLIFHPALESHSDNFTAFTRCLNIEMDREWRQSLPKAGWLERPADFYHSEIALIAGRLRAELQKSDPFSPLAVEGLTLELLANVTRQTELPLRRIPPRWLRQVKESLDDGAFTQGSHLRDLSKLVRIHPAHLARAFRSFYGCSVGEYLRKRRIELACRQIIQSTLTLSEVALATGFADQSHFTRVFRCQTGVTPNKYRALHRE